MFRRWLMLDGVEIGVFSGAYPVFDFVHTSFMIWDALSTIFIHFISID